MPAPDTVARALNVNGPSRSLCLTVTDTVARFAIPSWLAGREAVFVMDGADADIKFGASTVTCVYGQTSTVNAEAITEHTSTGDHMEDGIPRQWKVPSAKSGNTHFAVDCVGSGNGKLYISLC